MLNCEVCLKPEKFCTCVDGHLKHAKHMKPQPVVEEKVEVKPEVVHDPKFHEAKVPEDTHEKPESFLKKRNKKNK